jgi:hypothetical protein
MSARRRAEPERAQATRNISAAIETIAIVLSRGATTMKPGIATKTIVQYRVAATVRSSSSIDTTLGRNNSVVLVAPGEGPDLQASRRWSRTAAANEELASQRHDHQMR